MQNTQIYSRLVGRKRKATCPSLISHTTEKEPRLLHVTTFGTSEWVEQDGPEKGRTGDVEEVPPPLQLSNEAVLWDGDPCSAQA